MNNAHIYVQCTIYNDL